MSYAFDAQLVAEQMKYSGIIEVVRIRREGYPVRESFSDFLVAFDGLKRLLSIPKNTDDKEFCRSILAKYLPSNGYRKSDLFRHAVII
jgi:myosin heavy subunit